MRVLDYLRLGSKNIGAHKKRVLMVVVIVGVLFSVLTSASMLFTGIEKKVIEAQTAKTHGKVLLFVMVDTETCEDEECQSDDNLVEMRNVISKYGGAVIEGSIYSTTAGLFYEVPEGVLDVNTDYLTEEDIPVVAVPASTVQRWSRTSFESSWNIEKKIKAINNVKERSLHQVVTYKGTNFAELDENSHDKYYVADLLPPGGGASSLTLSGALQVINPLNLVLGNLNVGSGTNFVLKPSQGMLAVKKSLSDEGRLIASFSDIESAVKFTKDPATRCSEDQIMFHSCPPEYKFRVSPVMLNVLENYEILRELRKLFNLALVGFSVIAVVVATATFLRLLSSDAKTIALYYALGASRCEVRIIYLVYLMVICLITVGFVWLLALGITWLVNVLNAETLSQTFMLAYGGELAPVWLFGLSTEVFWVMTIVILLLAPIGVLIAWPVFSTKSLSKKMK